MCGVDECDKAAARKGLCRSHYRLDMLSRRKPCSVPECLAPWETEGMCGMHFQRVSRTGDVYTVRRVVSRQTSTVCEVDGCERPTQAKNLCKSHRQQARQGRPVAARRACLTCGQGVDLFKTNGRMRSTNVLCVGCRALKANGRWCMSVGDLAARDGRVCGLCHGEVDLDLSWPHPLSPSVDHIVPRARGGADEPSNLGLAHLTCNIKKGVRSGTCPSGMET